MGVMLHHMENNMVGLQVIKIGVKMDALVGLLGRMLKIY
jgi:hypothetical protein